MKYFLILIATILFSSCNSQVQPTVKYIEPEKTISQELGQRVFECDSALNIRDIKIAQLHDSLKVIRLKKDSISSQLFLANFKVEKVKYYLKICNKTPSNNKFLKGWVTRAVN